MILLSERRLEQERISWAGVTKVLDSCIRQIGVGHSASLLQLLLKLIRKV